jgi:hypothetical protein
MRKAVISGRTEEVKSFLARLDSSEFLRNTEFGSQLSQEKRILAELIDEYFSAR